MSAPLQTQISDLPPTGSVADTDYTIVRKGLADFKVQLGLVREIDVSAYPEIDTPANTDFMLINRGGTNYSVRFYQVGFEPGTTMWFYQDATPTGWELVENLGDTLLAVRGGSNSYQSFGANKGTWDQPSYALTIEQIPAHSHRVHKTKRVSGQSNNLGPCRGDVTELSTFATLPTGGEGSNTEQGNAEGKTLPHHHGSNWRPLANVGVLARKIA